MRIAIDGSHWAIPGGIRSYLENLLPALHRVAPTVELKVALRGRTAAVAGTLPACVTAVPMGWPRRLLDRLENHIGWPKIERFAGPVDVVHGTHFSLPRAARGVPTVLTVHDVAYLRRPDLYDDPAGNDYGYRYLLKHALRRADRVIALAHSSKEDLVAVTGFDPDRIWVVPHGVDPRFTPATAEEIARVRRRVGIEGDFVIYPVGTITPRKNIERTLCAFSMAFPDPVTRPALLLTGPSEFPTVTGELVGALGLSASVRCATVGYPDDLRALFTAARIGVYPSLYEGFGLPPLEAMACDLPMVVADRTSCPEVVGDAALMVDPESVESISDGIRTLYESDTARAELRQRGRRRVADPAFGWDRVARQTLAVYRDDRTAFEAEPDPLAKNESFEPTVEA